MKIGDHKEHDTNDNDTNDDDEEEEKGSFTSEEKDGKNNVQGLVDKNRKNRLWKKFVLEPLKREQEEGFKR